MTQDPLLYNQQPSARQVGTTAAVAASLFLIFASAIPFRDIKLWEINSYIPVIESLLMLGDLITAALLFSQATIMRSAALMALGTGYFFSSLALIPHALTFPGAFSPTGWLGAGVNTSAWLYLFWRPGLPAGAIAYALLKKQSDWPGTWPSPDRAIALCLASATALVIALTLLATAGDPLLPQLLSDSLHWKPTIVLYCVLVLLALNFVAIGLICRTFYSVLDLWLLLMLFTVTMELTMTSIIWGRFCLGWYVERTLGLFSGLLVLLLLLTETHRLYRQNMLRASAKERERERQLLIREATTASIVHELRQPLGAILLNAQAGHLQISHAGSPEEGISAILGDIVQESLRAKDIIDSTRSLFGKTPASKRPSDINQLLRKTLRLITRDLKDAGVSIDLGLHESLRPIAVNHLQMQELFLNLFTNALEAMNEQKGTVRVLTVTSSPGEDGVVIRIRDTGPGITDADIGQIFDAFYTTKKIGTGVGLTICHSIVTAHEGSLRVVPETATGATFEVYLPYNDASTSIAIERISSSETEHSDPARQTPLTDGHTQVLN